VQSGSQKFTFKSYSTCTVNRHSRNHSANGRLLVNTHQAWAWTNRQSAKWNSCQNWKPTDQWLNIGLRSHQLWWNFNSAQQAIDYGVRWLGLNWLTKIFCRYNRRLQQRWICWRSMQKRRFRVPTTFKRGAKALCRSLKRLQTVRSKERLQKFGNKEPSCVAANNSLHWILSFYPHLKRTANSLPA
jgi:hypothetical protein